jgi:hypothetical protein
MLEHRGKKAPNFGKCEPFFWGKCSPTGDFGKIILFPLLWGGFPEYLGKALRTTYQSVFLSTILQRLQGNFVMLLLGSIIIIVVKFFKRFIFVLSSIDLDLQWKIHL